MIPEIWGSCSVTGAPVPLLETKEKSSRACRSAADDGFLRMRKPSLSSGLEPPFQTDRMRRRTRVIRFHGIRGGCPIAATVSGSDSLLVVEQVSAVRPARPRGPFRGNPSSQELAFGRKPRAPGRRALSGATPVCDPGRIRRIGCSLVKPGTHRPRGGFWEQDEAARLIKSRVVSFHPLFIIRAWSSGLLGPVGSGQ